MYWATTAELQSSIPGVPDEYGLKARPSSMPAACFAQRVDGVAASRQQERRALLGGAGLTWASPFGALTRRLRRAAEQSRLRRRANRWRFHAGGF